MASADARRTSGDESAKPERALILEDAERDGTLGAPLEVKPRGWSGCPHLTLRPPRRIDPPIPMAPAFVLGEELARSSAVGAAGFADRYREPAGVAAD